MTGSVYKESITCPTQDGTLSTKSVPPIVGHSVKWHGRTPANALLSQDLSDFAKVVFGIMSLKVFHGNISTMGMRKLAQLCRTSKSRVHRAIAELAAEGHIAPAPKNRGQRGCYVLTSPVFGAKDRAGDVEEVIVSGPGRRQVAVSRKGVGHEVRSA